MRAPACDHLVVAAFEHVSPALWRGGKRLWSTIDRSRFGQWLRRRFPQGRSWFDRRLAPDRYLWLHLVFGVGLVLVAGNVFIEIAEAVVQRDTLVRFDRTLVQALYRNADPVAVSIFTVATRLGDLLLLAAIGVVVAVALLVRRRLLLLVGWSITLTGGALLNNGLKELFQRVRPSLPNPFLNESGWSFPSGHAMGSLIVYGMLTYLFVICVGRWIRPVIVIAVALVLCVGLSRLYLGVHFFSDVIAGYAAGSAWLAIGISGTEIARRQIRS
jgi:membrane-associated phospholipid phosphatase